MSSLKTALFASATAVILSACSATAPQPFDYSAFREILFPISLSLSLSLCFSFSPSLFVSVCLSLSSCLLGWHALTLQGWILLLSSK